MPFFHKVLHLIGIVLKFDNKKAHIEPKFKIPNFFILRSV